ncbi:sensor histidine kinase [Actinoplanes regularis]|uniref:sensor histidine kinase n=1 Tax=Actinoplanes regularis TaxID=52697 RepID=UPI0024A12271|nr:HAMP domain-containing sensor histidine kinase [Actinoplanes regularis]GLW31895.1 hypothetical protein Areg01_48340 [Actinoplanes regularis]
MSTPEALPPSTEAELRRRLRRHNRTLAELAATKTELVTALLHGLRTPLTAALGMLDILPEHTGDPALDEGLALIARNLHRIDAVATEISTISGLESGAIPLDRAEFDLPELLSEVAAEAGATCNVVPPTGPVTGDREWLGRIFTRILSAVRVLEGPAAIEAAGDADRWQVCFPLPPEQATDRLFTTGETGENAMALILARAVVTRHGGSVGLRSAGGTAYLRLTLPTGTESAGDL